MLILAKPAGPFVSNGKVFISFGFAPFCGCCMNCRNVRVRRMETDIPGTKRHARKRGYFEAKNEN